MVLCCLVAPRLGPQELPIRTWSVRDGLANSRVNSIRRDAHGFLWFSTWEGASRFDGRHFVNYSSREGLPNPLVWCTAESADGVVWLGTHGGGLASLAPNGGTLDVDPIGLANPSERVFEIAFDRDGRMWIVTDRGLFRAERAVGGRLQFEHVAELGAQFFGRAQLDEASELWFISADEMVRCRGREIERWPLPQGDFGELRAIASRRTGGFWVAYVRSLHSIVPPDPESPAPRRTVQQIDFGPNTSLYDVCENEAGEAWIATSRGLFRFDGTQAQLYTAAHGLPDAWVHSLAADPVGGLWVGMHQGGVAHLSASGVEHYTARSGLGDGHAVKLVNLGSQRWLVATEVAGIFELNQGRARLLPGSDAPPFERVQHNFARDGSGTWWIATSSGVFNAGSGELDLTRAVSMNDVLGAPATAATVLGVDPAGDVLLGLGDGRVVAGGNGGRDFREIARSPSRPEVRAFALGLNGASWLSDGVGLWRTRAGQPEAIDPWPGAQGKSSPRVLLFDSRGWLWVGTRFGGLAVTREPDAPRPQFERLSTQDGLVSDSVWTLCEDRDGTLYIGTGRGIQRYHPEQDALEPIGVDDELAGEWITDLEFDSRGELWVAAVNGVSRLPSTVRHHWLAPPRVRFMRCVLAGDEIELPAAGTFEPPPIEAGARDSRLSFEFVAVDPVYGAGLLYQTRLEGLDLNWSTPGKELGVRYGQLAAGSYRLSVRCVSPGTGAVGEASHCDIEIVPVLWMRPWFVAMTAIGLLGLGYWAHRMRLQRGLALERLRTQISSDMHDDFGGGLVQIAISSELARRSNADEARALMGEIAARARELRASMSDLVWAVDSRHDTLSDVVLRMRHCAGDMLAGEEQVVAFTAPEDNLLARYVVTPDWRRNIYLSYKESIANVARHARAQHISIEITLTPRRVRIIIVDDGCGFDAEASHGGNGLRNLYRRAEQLGAELAIRSAPGSGTRVVIEVPL